MAKKIYVWCVGCCLICMGVSGSVVAIKPPELPKVKEVVTPPYKGPLVGLKTDQILHALSPHVAVGKSGDVVELMVGLSATKMVAVVTKILEQNWLDRTSFLSLIFGLVEAYGLQDELLQNELFALGFTYAKKTEGAPILLVAVRTGHARSLPACITWLKKQPAGQQDFLYAALDQALIDNDVVATQQLIGHGVRVSAQQVDELLWKASGQSDADPGFVPLYMTLGADCTKAKQGYTPLMRAARVGNLSFVKALIKAGANPSRVVSPEVGSALQLAIEHTNFHVEEYLRSLQVQR